MGSVYFSDKQPIFGSGPLATCELPEVRTESYLLPARVSLNQKNQADNQYQLVTPWFQRAQSHGAERKAMCHYEQNGVNGPGQKCSLDFEVSQDEYYSVINSNLSQIQKFSPINYTHSTACIKLVYYYPRPVTIWPKKKITFATKETCTIISPVSSSHTYLKWVVGLFLERTFILRILPALFSIVCKN